MSVINLDSVRQRRLPVPVPPSYDQMIAAAADRHMLVQLLDFGRTKLETVDRGDTPLEPRDRAILMRMVAVLKAHPQ